jgi:hypothetical protein
MIFQTRQCNVFSKGRVTQNNSSTSSCYSNKGETKDTITRANFPYNSGIENWDIELSLYDRHSGAENRGKWQIP